MIPADVQDREASAAEYLHSMQSLTVELERAMQAIADNALSELEESVANQQTLSDQLGRLADELSVPLGASAARQTYADGDMIRRIHDAAGKLEKLNRQYAALLKHSSHSVALMSSLFSSFQGQFQEASGPRLKHQTWSCQM
jgi:hypothetical protein